MDERPSLAPGPPMGVRHDTGLVEHLAPSHTPGSVGPLHEGASTSDAPWSPAALQAFAYPDQLRPIFAERQNRFEQGIRLANTSLASVSAHLRALGVHASVLGLDFTPLQEMRYPLTPQQILMDRDVRSALTLLYGGLGDADVLAPGLPLRTAAAFAADQPSRLLPSTDFAWGMPLVRPLRRDGFIRVDSWSEYGVDDTLLLQLQAMAARGFSNNTHNSFTLAQPAEYLGQLLNSTRLASSLRGYLGPAVRFDGATFKRLGNGRTADDYHPGDWHHDRCGRRLKLAILLNDVTEDGHPLKVARGSHNTLYYDHTLRPVEATRIDANWVKAHHEVVSMTGRAGGGYIFDTNALHKGELEGTRERRLVMLEFHPHGKALTMHASSCPSRLKKAVTSDGVAHWPAIYEDFGDPAVSDVVRGEKGLPLYPQERWVDEATRFPALAGAYRSWLRPFLGRARA